MVLATLVLGCALSAHRSGMVQLEGERVTLVEPTGRSFRVAPSGQGALMRALEGYIVSVEGPRLGRRVWVRDWAVLDAGDGVPPFMGRLRRFGGNWLLDDRTSGQTIVLEPESVGDLASADGKVVVVRGLVVGAQTVRVLGWRVVEVE